ncbi:hypothetical protein GXW77_09885 [Roseomonas alkaliterrae]|uniref:Uncharacterized protein n=2 Tax=Neoroseomonas alkaliterrae TaxID=1452450 RepID=A0A840Y3H1_9PROT|nr:hypothetical protein [Neoroseomonas alkaliterrae]MBB5689182.1 hypothetical protein [Neoroseomonas alkaliterrae]MBR0676483.1 hypothetical protein [Neoroseomonas alkaliterrae]
MRSTDPSPAGAESSQAAILLAAVEAMEGTLAVAEALVAERRAVDLTGLEGEIGRLCAACLAAPRAMAPALRLRLESLLRAHDRLRAALAPP